MLDEAKDLIAQTEASVVLSGPILRQAADLDAAYLKLFPGEQVAIATEAQNNEAQVLQASLNDLQKDIEAKKREASEPYNNAIKRIREAVKPYTERIDARLNMLVPALRTYFLDQQRKAREEQERLNREAEKQRQKEEKKAEKKGVEPPPPTPAPIVVGPAKSVDLGGVRQTMRDNFVLRFAGMTEEEGRKLRRGDPRTKGLPDSLFILDVATLSAQARASKGINPYEGTAVQFVNEPIPSNRMSR